MQDLVSFFDVVASGDVVAGVVFFAGGAGAFFFEVVADVVAGVVAAEVKSFSTIFCGFT